MLGVEGYGSDSDNETQTTQTTSKSSLAASFPPPTKKSSIALPPPSNGTSATASSSKSASGLSLPPPKTKRSKKITIGLPELPPEDDKNDDDGPPTKKARIEPGARSSGLLSMLPAPKNKAPVPAAPERVLGAGRGPGLVFNTGSVRSSKSATVEDVPDHDQDDQDVSADGADEPEPPKATSSLPFLPPSLVKGKANVSVEERAERPIAVRFATSAPAVDFFSLGSPAASSSTSSPTPFVPSSFAPKLPLIPGVSSAPKVEDFAPPDPTPQDPYPGYYMLPSGSWAAYDPEYYRKFYDKWKKDYDNHVRALEKGAGKGFEDLETEGAQEVNAISEMERAKKEIQEIEEKKALTTGGADVPAAPKMNVKGAALGGRARTRHQLSTLLTEAYQNRDALEERIAQGRRNRKEAGNKYGK
ncbi:mitotic checkpoint regulator, MAD2B-interacting-domain-containing protein, partial [Rhodofomes roseus]